MNEHVLAKKWMKEFGQKLQKCYAEKGITRKQAAEAAGISERVLEEVERGEGPAEFGVDNFFALCQYFDMAPKDFFV